MVNVSGPSTKGRSSQRTARGFQGLVPTGQLMIKIRSCQLHVSQCQSLFCKTCLHPTPWTRAVSQKRQKAPQVRAQTCLLLFYLLTPYSTKRASWKLDKCSRLKLQVALGAALPHEYSAGLMRSGKQVAGEGLFGLTFKTVFGTSPEI